MLPPPRGIRSTLGDMGADVIKVEPPQGDDLRLVGPSRTPGMAPAYPADPKISIPRTALPAAGKK